MMAELGQYQKNLAIADKLSLNGMAVIVREFPADEEITRHLLDGIGLRLALDDVALIELMAATHGKKGKRSITRHDKHTLANVRYLLDIVVAFRHQVAKQEPSGSVKPDNADDDFDVPF
jgi:hypothetical protein